MDVHELSEKYFLKNYSKLKVSTTFLVFTRGGKEYTNRTGEMLSLLQQIILDAPIKNNVKFFNKVIKTKKGKIKKGEVILKTKHDLQTNFIFNFYNLLKNLKLFLKDKALFNFKIKGGFLILTIKQINNIFINKSFLRRNNLLKNDTIFIFFKIKDKKNKNSFDLNILHSILQELN